MLDGEQVASRISVPRFSMSLDGVLAAFAFRLSFFPLCSCVAPATSRMYSFASIRKSAVRRLRKLTRAVGFTGGSWLKRSIPMKYCRYGFSWISFITARSESFFRFCMTSMPRAIRRGVAGWPVLEGNSAAYLISIFSHGMACASLTHSFSGSSCIPQDWLKSNRVIWRFLRLSGIYMGFCTSKMQIY